MADPASRAGAVLEIDLGAIAANWRLLAARAAPAQCAAVVKANAYGLGAAMVAPALAAAGCRVFFVASLNEGIALRQAVGKTLEIAILNGPPRGSCGEFIEYGLIPVLNEPGQIQEWQYLPSPAPRERGDRLRREPKPAGLTRVEAVGEGLDRDESCNRPLTPSLSPTGGEGASGAILHVDTGMSRLGLTGSEFTTLVENPPPIAWRGVMSHLACADEPDHQHNPRQLARFASIRTQMPGVPASLAASSGIFLGPDYHFDLVRPGAALYGVNPQPGQPNPMRPVLRLSGKILQIRQIDRGESVGYGAAHVMEMPGRVATVAVGYADGWLRSLSHRGCGYIAGKRVPLLGRVSMDLATFDVSGIDPVLAYPGATIELLGPHYGVDEAAADAGTIGYEILTSLGTRYHRVYTPA